MRFRNVWSGKHLTVADIGDSAQVLANAPGLSLRIASESRIRRTEQAESGPIELSFSFCEQA